MLTDNEKTVTVEHIAGIPVRNALLAEFARHYSVVVHTCVPADPASKGGTESSVKLAKADLVPAEVNLRPEYGSFAELERACEEFCDLVNNRQHRVTRRVPADMLAEERLRLHPVAASPFTVAFGTTRVVPTNTPMISFENSQYSVPHQLMGATVWVRVHGQGDGEQVIITHLGADGPVEVARHLRATPGTPRLDDAHFPAPPVGALERQPRAKTTAEKEFLALGEGARLWLIEAAAAGTVRVRSRWPPRSNSPGCSPLARSTGLWGMPPCTAGSLRPTSPASWTTTSRPAGPSTGPVRTPPSPRAPTAGPATAPARRSTSDHPNRTRRGDSCRTAVTGRA